MDSEVNKRAKILSTAVILTACAGVVFSANNQIVDIVFNDTGTEVTANVITSESTSTPVRASKSGNYYNIILPNITVGSKTNFKPKSNKIESVKVTSMDSSVGSGTYTKIQIKTVPGVILTASGSIYNNDNSQKSGENAFWDSSDENNQEENVGRFNDRNIEVKDFNHDYEKEERNLDRNSVTEESFEEDEDFENVSSIPQEQFKPLPSEELKPEKPSAAATKPPQRDYTSEILMILIGSLSVILVIILLYIKGRDRMKELCGDMDLDLSATDKKNVKSVKTRQKKKTESIERGIIDLSYNSGNSSASVPANPPIIDYSEEQDDEQENVIDIDAIFSQKNSDVTPGALSSVSSDEAQSSDDLDDFLDDFVDDDIESGEETKNEKTEDFSAAEEYDNAIYNISVDENIPYESPVDNLIDDVISVSNITFTEEDISKIQRQLQSDLSSEILDEVSKEVPVYPAFTVEEFDKLYPMLAESVINPMLNIKEVKFNDIDRNLLYELTRETEMSEDAIIEAQIRKDAQDVENINYYESEQDFAFTLIKTSEVENTDELVVLDNNVYPDLDKVDFSNDEIFKEFSLIKPDLPPRIADDDTAPTQEEIDLAILNEIKLMQMSEEEEEKYKRPEKNEPDEISDVNNEGDSILSEFSLIKPDVEPVKDDDEPQTVFTSMDDIESQFRALGVEFDSPSLSDSDKNNELIINENPELINVEDVSPLMSVNIESVQNKDTAIDSIEQADIYASCSIDETTELYISYYEGKTLLVGMKNNSIKPLYEFEPGKVPSGLSAKQADVTQDGSVRYIVKADKYKFVIETSENDVSMVLVL